MNESINSIKKTYNYLIKNCKAKSIILSPNEEWDLKDKNNDESINFWEDLYKNIKFLNYNNISKTYSSKELIAESKKYICRIKENNNFFIIKILYYLNFFPSIKIFYNRS